MGLKIEELSEDGKVTLIADIKNDVYQRHGIEGVRILTMGSTGTLLGIIQYLSSIKIENKSERGSKVLETKIIAYMNAHYELFFVFSIGSASEQAIRVIASLKNDGVIRKKGYMFNLYSIKEDMAGRVMHTWAFQNLYNFETMAL